METTIENIKYSHLQELKELYENCFEGSTSDLNKMQHMFSKIDNNPDYEILVAITDGIVTGSVMGVLCSELFGQCRPFMVVENVGVLKEYRKQGIAKALLVELEKRARDKNCSMILFVSSHYHTEAHKLYESLGFATYKVNGYRKRLN